MIVRARRTRTLAATLAIGMIVPHPSALAQAPNTGAARSSVLATGGLPAGHDVGISHAQLPPRSNDVQFCRMRLISR